MSGAAPLGYNLNGTPKTTRRGRPRKDAPKKAGTGPAAPSPRSTRPASSNARKKNYTDGLRGILHMAALPLLPTLPLDAAAILVHADELAGALNTTAQHRPEIAAMCEKIMTAGPYGLLIAAVLKPAAQIAVNHGLIPEAMAVTFGALPRDQLAARLAAMMPGAPAPAPVVPEQHVNGYAHAGA